MNAQAKIMALGPRFNDDLTALVEEYMLPKMAKMFRAKTPFLNTIHLDGADEVEEVGDEITMQMPFDLGEANVMPVDGESAPTSYKAQKVKMKIDQHLYKEVTMSSRAFSTHRSNNTIPGLFEACVDSLAKGVNVRAQQLPKDVYNFIGTANGNTRSTNDVIDLADFLDGVCPEDNRFLGLHRKTNGDLLKEMQDLSKFGNSGINNGIIGNLQNMAVYKDIGLPMQISGGAGSSYTVSGAHAAGATAITVAAGTGNFNQGDVLSIAGNPQTYVVTADQTGAGAVSIFPALAADLAGGEAVTVQDDHPLDIGYHKTAFAVAFRKLEDPDEVEGARVFTYTDPVTKIPFRLVRWFNGSSSKTHWKFEVLAGFKTIRPEWACRMLAG